MRAVLGKDFDVVVEHDVDTAMARLGGIDLLIANSGDPWRNDLASAGAPPESVAGLRAALDRGIGVLAVHSAVSTLRDYPEWAAAIGRIWIPGSSFHPPAGPSRITHATSSGFAAAPEFEVFDERYCQLQPVGDSRVVAWHEGAGNAGPAAWIREFGRSRVAVDVLGHDTRSYESEEHRALILRLAHWAVQRPKG